MCNFFKYPLYIHCFFAVSASCLLLSSCMSVILFIYYAVWRFGPCSFNKRDIRPAGYQNRHYICYPVEYRISLKCRLSVILPASYNPPTHHKIIKDCYTGLHVQLGRQPQVLPHREPVSTA